MLRLFVGPCSFLPISRVEPLGLLGSRVGFGWHGRLALMSVSKQGWFRFVKSKDKFTRQMFSMEDCL